MDGKEFFIEEVEAKEADAGASTEAAGAGEDDGKVDDAQIDAAAEKMVAKLGLDKILKSLEELKEVKSPSAEKKVSALVDLEKLMKKDVSEMTAKEKIIGFFQGMIRNDHAVMKALSEGTAADGGYLFPDEFRAEIIRELATQPRMRNEVRVVPMKRDVMNMPSLTNTPKVYWTLENSAKTTTTANFGQITLTAKKMAAILYASDELIEDSDTTDVVQFIIGLFAEAIGQEEDRVITRGNGTTEPTGYHGFSTIASITCGGNLDFDDLIDLEYALPGKYQRNAKWFVNRENLREMRKLKDTTGRYLWQDAVTAGGQPTWHGFPIVEDNNLPSADIYFGDLQQAYWLGDRQQMTVKVTQDSETAFTRDQTAIRVVARIAGNVVQPKAMKRLASIP